MLVPWRYLIGLLSGVALAIAVFIGFLYSQLGIPVQAGQWVLDVIKKKEALIAAVPGPKLILLGGSGTFFGVQAKLIQEQTGVPTINLGTNAALQTDYILDLARRNATPGDTVLLVFEYELYTADFGSEPHDSYILASDPAYFRQMSLFDKIAMATRVPFKRFQKGWRNQKHPEKPGRPHPPYTDAVRYVNENGDETGNAAADKPKVGDSMLEISDPLTHGIHSTRTPQFDVLRSFLAWARANHVTVLATFPNIMVHPEYDSPHTAQAIKTITDFYASENVPVVGTARESMLPQDDFFDTCYHLTREAAEKRTERLIPELKPRLQTSR